MVVKVLCDIFVDCTCFCNDEVEEDDASQDDCEQPNNPKQICVCLSKEVNFAKQVEVTEGYSQRLKKISAKLANMHVFNARSFWVKDRFSAIYSWLIVLLSEFALNGVVSKSSYSEHKSKQKDQDSVERHEDSELPYNLVQHGHDRGQCSKDPQEVKCSPDC